MPLRFVLVFVFFTFFLTLEAQVKIGLWEPNYKGNVKSSIFFTGDSLITNQSIKKDEHGIAVGYTLLNGLGDSVEIFHAGFTPLTQHLTETGVLKMTVVERQKNLPHEYAYYHNFAIKTVAWFKKQKVRLVNMSFGTSASIFAENNQNLGNTDQERFEAAKKWMGHFKASFDSAFRSAPGIMFVVAAGNDEEDMEQSFDVPALVNLPNVICVGALSKDGQRKISNFGKRVDVYVPAEDVEWKDENNQIKTGTGTSLAVPIISNRIIKQLLRNPNLKISELTAVIRNVN